MNIQFLIQEFLGNPFYWTIGFTNDILSPIFCHFPQSSDRPSPLLIYQDKGASTHYVITDRYSQMGDGTVHKGAYMRPRVTI